MQYTKSLLHFDKTNDLTWDEIRSNEFETPESPAYYQAGEAKFGTSGLKVAVTNAASIRSKTTFNIFQKDWTLEYWTKGGGSVHFYRKDLGYGSGRGGLFLFETGNGGCYYGNPNNGTYSGSYISNVVTRNPSNWTHHAIVYNASNSTVSFYENGTLKRSVSTQPCANTGYVYSIGSGTNSVAGSIDEFRLSIGIMRYTNNFTPQTQQHIYGPYAEFPSNLDGTYTTAPNKLKYYYKVKFEQGPYTQTSNVVNYETCQKLRLLMYLYKILIISIFLKTLKIRVVS